MSRSLETRLTKLETVHAPSSPWHVFRILAYSEDDREKQIEELRKRGFDNDKDVVIARIVTGVPKPEQTQ